MFYHILTPHQAKAIEILRQKDHNSALYDDPDQNGKLALVSQKQRMNADDIRRKKPERTKPLPAVTLDAV